MIAIIFAHKNTSDSPFIGITKYLEKARVQGDTEDIDLGLIYSPYEHLQAETPPFRG